MTSSLAIGNKPRRDFIKTILVTGFSFSTAGNLAFAEPIFNKKIRVGIRVGIIGLSVHSADFTAILNAETLTDDLSFCKVVALYHPKRNDGVEFTAQQLREFSNTIKNHGVEFVYSIEALLDKVYAVMLLTNDGRPHLEQVLPVFKSGKPVFIDKPIADTLRNVKAIFNASKQYGVPLFSSSALRYGKNVQNISQGKIVGQVLGADTYGPSPLQKSHVDLFWDGIHSVETLYTVMGTGCQWVSRSHVEGSDVVIGTWKGGRLGVFRGLRGGKSGFGGTVYGVDGVASIGGFAGYRPLVVAIVDFFRTNKSPVSMEETLEIYAFMEAADQSKRRGGDRVSLSTVLSEAD